MASSSRIQKRKNRIVYDDEKFANENAQTRYIESVSKRVLIAERGLTVSPDMEGIWNMIERRGWQEFCAQPKPAVVALVREFYANAPDHEGKKVFVRGKQVSFGGRAINRLFQLRDIENDEYKRFIDEDIDYQEIIRQIAAPGTQWKMTDHRPVTFKSLGLVRECKAWYYFLGARLMPVRHFSDVTKEKAALLYCLVTGKTLDVGKFISSNIVHCYNHQSMSLYYPSLITALCVAAGVRYSADEETLAPMAALTDNKIYGMKNADSMSSLVPIPQVRPQTSRPLTLAERLERVEDRMREQGEQLREHGERFQSFQEYQYGCNNTMAEMMRQLAIGMAVDLDHFPTMPPYPGQMQHEMPDFSQTEVGDGGGADAEDGADDEDVGDDV